MSTDQLSLQVIAERPVVRNDQISDIDIAIDLLTTKTIGPQSTNYAINLCIVIDRSGSMAGEKLEQAKKSCVDIYESLNSSDRLTVLAFDDEVISVVNPQTPSNLIKERIMALEAGGATNLSKGWYLGLLELQTYTTDKHINRLILLSDGQANAGEQKPSTLGAESSRARNEMGITTSTIGIGTDFQEDILAALAHESGGRFRFIGEARIEDIIKEEFDGALSVFLERPRIELNLLPGVIIIRELNNLHKTSDRYLIRPIKANDQFCFALRLRVDPSKVDGKELIISATLLNGTDLVQKTETNLSLGSMEEYVQSPEDSRVAMVVTKYLAATFDEEMAEEMGTGNVTTMLQMLQSQSNLMKELESKLAGATAISWETMTEQEREKAEMERQRHERELSQLRMEIEENEALAVVIQLTDLAQGLGQAEQASRLIAVYRKLSKGREMRKKGWAERGDSDDWVARKVLEEALDLVDSLMNSFPDMQEEFLDISERINEQLANFS
ncbi:vWA domain-containing protein [Scytonema sp. PRP1]|uniref:vWA domain-containing protein n=1 Tax=Scytonema sp. PRP1 TaxID=3120513 RepID=UPI002FD34829